MRANWWCGIVMLAALTGACGARDTETSTDSSEITVDNGLTTNGLVQNGIFQNGIFQNGIFQNGIWENGIFQNGIFQNGIFQNGIFQNGIFQNGIFQNGIFQNALWQTDLAAREMLRTNTATRKLLQYIYECAMTADQTATLDPGDGTSIVLRGKIGLAPSWGEDGGTCDRSCQRWVSACVLARTNAYGVTVDISMRVPDTAPDHIKAALRVDAEEAGEYRTREGAFYGNLFATTTQPDGVVVNTPSFYACAGPGSNIPDITKRFCSSQGDNGPIQVPGVCEPREAWPAATCEGIDSTTGAMRTCYSNTNHAAGERYDEVITVYIREPLAVCGNAVCESGESSSCQSDCLPGGWTQSFSKLVVGAYSNPAFAFGDGDHTMNELFANGSDVAPDGTIVLAGLTLDTVDVGGGALPPTGGELGVLAKYEPDGTHRWSKRFGVGVPVTSVWGTSVAVDRDGNIVVAGRASTGAWVQKFSPDGDALWTVRSSGSTQAHPTRVVTAPNGDIVIAGDFGGSVTFGAHTLTAAGTNTEVFVAKLDASGAVQWATRRGDASLATALAVAASGDVAIGLFARTIGTGLVKLNSDGTLDWEHPGQHWSLAFDANGDLYASGSLADRNSSYAFVIETGYAFEVPAGADRGDFFIAKYAGSDGAPLDVVATIPPCRSSVPQAVCQNRFDGRHLTFDAAGNLVVGIVGGNGYQIDFGAGPFSMYGTWDVFVASYSPDLEFRWARHVPMILDGILRGLDVAPDGRIVMSGSYAGSMLVDNRLLVNQIPELRAYGNTFLAAFTPPPLADTTPPVLDRVSDPVVLEATSSAGALGWYMPPTAIDTGLAGTSVSCSPAANTMFPLGTTTVTCTGSDPVGNPSTTTFPVTVVDRTGPAFAAIAAPVVEATGPVGAAVTFDVDANDRVDGARPVTCTPATNTTFAIGATPVVCTAADSAGNHSATGFTVTVRDTTPPAIAVPASITTFATSAAGAPVSYAVSAADIVDGVVLAACSMPSGATFPLGTTVVLCTASDATGNLGVATFQVVVGIPWSGILQPINSDGSSTFKLGRTIPVKLELTGPAAGITNAVITLSLTKLSSTVTGTQNETVSAASADAGNTFRYDPQSGTYIFNLSTKPLSFGTWRLDIDMGDGIARSVVISLKN